MTIAFYKVTPLNGSLTLEKKKLSLRKFKRVTPGSSAIVKADTNLIVLRDAL